MTQAPLITTLSPEDYVERVILRRQQQEAAAADPGYILPTDDGNMVGFVLGWVEESQPETTTARRVWAVRRAIASLGQRIVDTIDPTVRFT